MNEEHNISSESYDEQENIQYPDYAKEIIDEEIIDESTHKLKYDFYPWQIEAWKKIKDKNAVLSAPTGSGKTWVAYLWAGLFGEDGRPIRPSAGEKIIFTAPIKALSNERYMDLLGMGFDVGIETGDFKKNTLAPVICCTQEIYDLKYAGLDGLKVIIDEFHYIFTESERSRAYIDGIVHTSPTVPILLMSATFGQPENVRKYLERITNRPFELYINQKRATELHFMSHGLMARDVHDALVFVFSQTGTQQIADLIADERLDFDVNRKSRLRDLAWILEVKSIRRSMFRGVGVYHGGLLPKEKLLVERAYRERIIDVVVGTDALALGVNLPAETVIFGQTVKFHDRMPITKNAFLQMSGRAGRKGLFDKGYVTWLMNSPAESRGIDTGQMFGYISKLPMEEAKVELRPDFGAILKNISTIEEEARIVSSASLPEMNYEMVKDEITKAMRVINKSITKIVPHKKEQFRQILADVWYSEMEVEQNIEMAELFFWGVGSDENEYAHPDGMTAAEVLQKYERNFLQALLRVKRFNNSLPEEYKLTGMQAVDRAIIQIDPTVFGFEEKIQEMESTKVELPVLKRRMVNFRSKTGKNKRNSKKAFYKNNKDKNQRNSPSKKSKR